MYVQVAYTAVHQVAEILSRSIQAFELEKYTNNNNLKPAEFQEAYIEGKIH